MCEEEVLPRALQNHLLQERHLTTLLGLCMPQYLGYVSMAFSNVDIQILTRMHEQEVLSLHRRFLGVCAAH